MMMISIFQQKSKNMELSKMTQIYIFYQQNDQVLITSWVTYYINLTVTTLRNFSLTYQTFFQLKFDPYSFI